MTETWTTLLAGIVGSHAYGLNGPDSDVDRLQFAAAPTSQFHGLYPPIGKRATRDSHDPDLVVHEVGKAVFLLLKANPTVSELLWLPEYEVKTELGQMLIDIRSRILGARHVRNSYLGYASQQFQRLVNKGRFPDVPESRIAKHARHLLRIVTQGTELYVTGELTVKVDDPQRYHDFGRRVVEDPTIAGPVMYRAECTFADSRTPLSENADEVAAEAWLHMVRGAYYQRARAEG